MLGVFNVVSSASGVSTLVSDPDGTDNAPSNSAAPLFNSGAASTNPGGSQVQCWTNTNAQIRHREVLTAGTVSIATVGWTDLRGKDL